MADLYLFVPFILRWAAGVGQRKDESIEVLFERAKLSGWSDHPLDRGGATQCDVTFTTYADYCRRKRKPVATKERLRHIAFNEWLEILKENYWDKWCADDILVQAVAEILVDWVWASGAKSIRSAQRVIGVSADGIVGPQTLSAVNAADPAALFARLHQARVDYVTEITKRNPTQKIWLKGWLNRINAIHHPA